MEIFGWVITAVLAVFYIYALWLLGKDVFGHGVYERHEKQKVRNMRRKSGYKHHDK